jgi:hypothetical protein
MPDSYHEPPNPSISVGVFFSVRRLRRRTEKNPNSEGESSVGSGSYQAASHRDPSRARLGRAEELAPNGHREVALSN